MTLPSGKWCTGPSGRKAKGRNEQLSNLKSTMYSTPVNINDVLCTTVKTGDEHKNTTLTEVADF